ncbi:MAG: NAD-dependent epimerase/dehydratase family protein [Oscillospiraceae bacterium]|nr:NAD-dependent epimerase/dehydratase family protein [Oscillospiraceae bacterium]
MNIILLGAAGFIGSNLTLALARDAENSITVVSRRRSSFDHIAAMGLPNVRFIESELTTGTDYDRLLAGQELVYHLISTTVPTTSNIEIARELDANVILSARLFESCARVGVRKVVFLSSGGTVYGKAGSCPLREDTPTDPITSYGIQKLAIEKLLYLYHHIDGFDYRIVRLANPYGPWQRPNGILGAVTTFTYRMLAHEPIPVYGDGSVVRDFLYIDDAVRGILNIASGDAEEKLFNLGSGYGTSILQVLKTVRNVLGLEPEIRFEPAREVDVPVNYLDISRYEASYGRLNPLPLEEGIRKTADFLIRHYNL